MIRKIILIAILLFLVFIMNFDPTTSDDGRFCKEINYFSGIRFGLLNHLNIYSGEPDVIAAESCNLAFYSGLAKSFELTSSYESLNSSCLLINKSFAPRLWDQCYFKVGDGLAYSKIADNPGNESVIREVDSGLEFCNGTANRLSCIAGVFTGLNKAYTNDLKADNKHEPFWVCNAIKQNEHKLQCMRNMASYLYNFAGGDLDLAIKVIADNSDSDLEKYEATHTLFSSLAFINEIKEVDIPKVCMVYEDREVRFACISGYANGITETVESGTETQRVKTFCTNPAFKKQEQAECLRRAFSEIPVVDKKMNCRENASEEFVYICGKVD